MAAVGLNDHWSSRWTFLMASIGFAVGLGNIWRFPYIAGENGGAAFVLVYLACVILIGIPCMMAEIMLGRRGQGSPTSAVAALAKESDQSTSWRFVGGMGLWAAFTIVIVYAGIVGWVLWYLFKALTTGFLGFDGPTAALEFDSMLLNTPGMLLWTLLGIGITGAVIFAGVKGGIERAVTILMPLLFLLLVSLAIYNMFAGGFGEAVTWLFTPDFSKIGPEVFLVAVGQAFFSIGVAMGGMMVYGAYLPKSISIAKSAVIIIAADTLVALVAGLVVFPAVFYNGLDPAAGPGLIFQTLPVAFANMPGGHLFSVAFFLMLAVAGITSMVGLIEPVTAYFEDRHGVPRHRAALSVIVAVAILSVVSLLSYNTLSEVRVGGFNFNDIMDTFSNMILLPLGGLFIALFAGWIMRSEFSKEELAISESAYRLWQLTTRYVVPPALVIIFFFGITG
jgi:neurotransmitter:Na+ symporter, NSS family